MKRSRRWQWQQKSTVTACALLTSLAALTSCTSLHRENVHANKSVPQESVQKKSVSGELPRGVRIVNAAAVEQEMQREAATLGRSRHESIVASDEGYYLDVLQARLQQAAGEHAEIRRDGQQISLEIRGQITTDTSGPRLDSVTEGILTKLGKVFVEYYATVITVQVLDANAKDADPASVAPTASAVVRRFVQKWAASTHLLLVAPDSARAGKPQSASNADVRIDLRIRPILRTLR